MSQGNVNYKLLVRIFKHSTPAFHSRVEAFINNNKKREFENYNQNKEKLNEYGNQVCLALFLLIKKDELISILLSKISRFVGISCGIKQTELIAVLSKELIILLKYNSSKEDNLPSSLFGQRKKLTQTEQGVVLSICEKLNSITVDSKFQFGILIMDFIMSEFDYIFDKHTNYEENKENHIIINIKKEYLAVLAGAVFYPIRIPMVTKPKKWGYKIPNNSIDGIQLFNTGGYFLGGGDLTN